MILSLTRIIEAPGLLEFDYNMDLRDLEINYEKPFKNPVRVTGGVSNNAGIIELSCECESVVSYRCARCAEEAEGEFYLEIAVTLAERLENPDSLENADVTLISNEQVDIDAVVRDAVILESDMVYLCKEDCLGLCPDCGKNLNEGGCLCGKKTDPRLDKLKELLDGMENG
ncbi:MAG: DUF177 domain-containing protein [Oscillospiraceae bacterium]|jgi:uncharacterized protein|nr:DUF177 domain-containing protein [Oscillospiraceae bacterium]